jgi:hypothetical protein
VVQNTKRSREDVLEPALVRDNISETTTELVEKTKEHTSKRFRSESE